MMSLNIQMSIEKMELKKYSIGLKKGPWKMENIKTRHYEEEVGKGGRKESGKTALIGSNKAFREVQLTSMRSSHMFQLCEDTKGKEQVSRKRGRRQDLPTRQRQIRAPGDINDH